MKKLVYDIIRKLEHLDYADVRLTVSDTQNIFFEKGELKHISSDLNSAAVGIRVLVEGCWGFAGTKNLDTLSLDKAVKRAISNAQHGAKFKTNRIKLTPVKPTVKSYFFRPEIDPFLMSDEEKISYFSNIAAMMTNQDKIVQSNVSANFFRQYKIFANTEGTFTDSLVYDTKGEIFVLAAGDGKIYSRTYPGHMAARRGGFEVIKNFKFEENVEKTMEEAIALINAPVIEDEKADIIIGGGHLALQLHESVGHATEADRIFGMEISYAGKTFVRPDMLGNFQYGSDIVTIFSDSTDPKGLGYHVVDDEGVPGRKVEIIKNGILNDQQTAREFAGKLGLEPSSNMKASFADDFPLVRMTNFCLAPVSGSLGDLIKSTEYGYYIDYTKTWSIDDNRNNFQFTTEIGWFIKDGEIKHIVKEPTYWGITPEFWNACDAICGPEEWEYHGTFNCGKGEPGQAMHLSHGVAPARFKNINVNVKA